MPWEASCWLRNRLANSLAFRIVFGLTVAANASATSRIDPALAAQYFAEARALCERDGGQLWGVSLCGPMLFADSQDHEGRLWLQLEWRALREALSDKGAGRRRAVSDALLFRAQRRSLFPQAGADERALEMQEGLAEYTGIKLACQGDAGPEAMRKLQEAERTQSLVRSFAYASGPAYGILLDEAGAKWRANLNRDSDLGALLRSALSLPEQPATEKTAALAGKRYGGAALRAAEEERDARRRERLARYRAALVDGPVLKLPLQKMSIQFNPDEVYPLEQWGTVYPSLRIVDNWGVLTAAAGALVAPGFNRVSVPAPSDTSARPLRGEGWTLELNEGWALVPGERGGDYALKRSN